MARQNGPCLRSALQRLWRQTEKSSASEDNEDRVPKNVYLPSGPSSFQKKRQCHRVKRHPHLPWTFLTAKEESSASIRGFQRILYTCVHGMRGSPGKSPGHSPVIFEENVKKRNILCGRGSNKFSRNFVLVISDKRKWSLVHQ